MKSVSKITILEMLILSFQSSLSVNSAQFKFNKLNQQKIAQFSSSSIPEETYNLVSSSGFRVAKLDNLLMYIIFQMYLIFIVNTNYFKTHCTHSKLSSEEVSMIAYSKESSEKS